MPVQNIRAVALRRRAAAVLAAVLPAWAAAQTTAPASARVQRQGDSIVFDGRIDARSAAAFLRELELAPVRRLVVTSGGGLVTPALDMAEAIWRAGIDIEVPRTCLSSCANYLFPAARGKRLGRPDAVAWHGNMAHVLYLAQSGQATWPAADLADAYRLARREEAFYRRLGVDGFVAWFGKLAPYAVPEFYTLSPEDMARFGVRDVQVAEPAAPLASDRVLLDVDAARLDAIRPPVRLDDDAAADAAPR